jgi:hypothetical protein
LQSNRDTTPKSISPDSDVSQNTAEIHGLLAGINYLDAGGEPTRPAPGLLYSGRSRQRNPCGAPRRYRRPLICCSSRHAKNSASKDCPSRSTCPNVAKKKPTSKPYESEGGALEAVLDMHGKRCWNRHTAAEPCTTREDETVRKLNATSSAISRPKGQQIPHKALLRRQRKQAHRNGTSRQVRPPTEHQYLRLPGLERQDLPTDLDGTTKKPSEGSRDASSRRRGPSTAQWDTLKALRTALRAQYARFRKLTAGVHGMRKLRKSYKNATDLLEVGLLTFKHVLQGGLPSSLKEVFAFATVSKVMSDLLRDRASTRLDCPLGSLPSWRDVLQDEQDRTRLDEVISILWPTWKTPDAPASTDPAPPRSHT